MDNQNIQNLSGSTTVWVGNNPYLVNSAGVIPLTSGFSALALNQSPPQTDVSSQGQFYVVSVQESPTKKSPQGLSNPRTGLGLYNSSDLTASSPNLGNISNNNFQPQPINFQYNSGLNQFPPTFTNGQSQQFPPTFTNGQSQQFPPTFTNGQSQQFSPTFANGRSQQFPPTSTNSPNLPAFTNGQSQQFPSSFTNGQIKQFPPTFTNGQNPLTFNNAQHKQFAPTITNGFSTLPNPQKPLTINPSSTTNNLNGNYQASTFQNGISTRNFSENESVTLASPSLSTSSTSILSESSYSGYPSPDAGVNCVYKSDPQSPSRIPSALTGPATLPKPKRSSVTGEKDVNDNETPKTIYPTVPPCYERPVNKEYCLRCSKKVYHMEKLGPVKECLYHKLCFRCVVCNTTLNIKNYHVNPNDMEDLNVYCVTHMPSNKSVSVDAGAVGIKGALGAPKLDIINQQIRGRSDAQYGNEALGYQTGVNVQRKHSHGSGPGKYKGHTYNLEFESYYQLPSLQTSNQIKDLTWSRNERQPEVVPQPDVDYNATRLYNSP